MSLHFAKLSSTHILSVQVLVSTDGTKSLRTMELFFEDHHENQAKSGLIRGVVLGQGSFTRK